MLQGTPSPWMNLPIEQVKEMKDRFKLSNDIEREKQRETELKQKGQDLQGQTQMQAMKETLPFLDRG